MPPDPPRMLCVIRSQRKIRRTARAAWLHQTHSMCAPPSSTSESTPDMCICKLDNCACQCNMYVWCMLYYVSIPKHVVLKWNVQVAEWMHVDGFANVYKCY